jgi:hypothetical protein
VREDEVACERGLGEERTTETARATRRDRALRPLGPSPSVAQTSDKEDSCLTKRNVA